MKSGQCACVRSYFELDNSFEYEKTCSCPLPRNNAKTQCENPVEQWHILSSSNVIDLIDAEVGESFRICSRGR